MMDDDAFEATHKRLVSTLGDLADLLQRSGESHWADWIAADRAAIGEGNRRALDLDHFLPAFGGMGSLNDVILRTRDGHTLDEDERRSLNVRFALPG